jgi:glyoxylase-like metal-dependent hydrolase (beta-lactamase superfamily II)
MPIKAIQPIGQRGRIITFDDDISVYLIQAKHHWFLCDTHLGPQSMEELNTELDCPSGQPELILFNSHSDWDHIWGNCAFPGATVIGHDLCRTRMQDIGRYELETLSRYHRGTIALIYPNLTFSQTLQYAEEGVAFHYAPGHTVDSAVCFDQQDSVLFVGDLVEYPIPYLDFADLSTYLGTLAWLRQFPAAIKVSAHSGIVDEALIERNMAYIRAIQEGQTVEPTIIQPGSTVHTFNLNNRLFLEYEHQVRQKLGAQFDYYGFRNCFGDLHTVDYEALARALKDYMHDL